MTRRLMLLFVGLLLCTAVSTSMAAPMIDFGMTPGLPGYVQNPGGLLTAWCNVDTDGTTPVMLRVRLLDGNGQEVFLGEYPESTYYYLYWYVPTGLTDGIYKYQVEYISQEGPSAEISASFIVAGLTRGLCAFKFIDDDSDGIFDEGVESLASGWEICLTGPLVECKTTDADGVACWFFIPAGVYEVCETMQPGYTPTTPPCQTVEITTTIGKALFGNAIKPPDGACCYPGCECIIQTESDCSAGGGVYQGDGTICDPNPCECPPPNGACCLIDGSCVSLTASECADQNGVYQGDNTVCEPNPCPPPTATERSTWGRVKANYR